MQKIFLPSMAAIALQLMSTGASAQPQIPLGEQIQKTCGTFDLDQLEADLKNDTFERGGVELSKAVIAKLKQQIECERAHGNPTPSHREHRAHRESQNQPRVNGWHHAHPINLPIL